MAAQELAGAVLLIISGSGVVAIDQGTALKCAEVKSQLDWLKISQGTRCRVDGTPCEPISGLKYETQCVPGKAVKP
jgi:hypothetical protein